MANDIPFVQHITMMGNTIKQLLRPTQDDYAATKRYVDDYTQHDRSHLFNPNFRVADPTDALKALGWTFATTGGGTITRDTSKLVFGLYSVKLVCGSGQTAQFTSDPVDVFNPTTPQLASLYDTVAQLIYITTSTGGVLTLYVDWQDYANALISTWTVGSRDFSTADKKNDAIFGHSDPALNSVQAVIRGKLVGPVAGACTLNVSRCKLDEAVTIPAVGSLDIKQGSIQFTNDVGVTKYGQAIDNSDVLKQFGEVTLETGANIVGGGVEIAADTGLKVNIEANPLLEVNNGGATLSQHDGTTGPADTTIGLYHNGTQVGEVDTHAAGGRNFIRLLSAGSGNNTAVVSDEEVSIVSLHGVGLDPGDGNVDIVQGGIQFPDSTVQTTKGIASPLTTQDDLFVGGASGVPARLAKGSDSQVLTVDPSTHHLVWATPSTGMTNPMTTQDDVIVGGSSGTPGRLAKGSDGQVLRVDPSTHHLTWYTPPAGTVTNVTGVLPHISVANNTTTPAISHGSPGSVDNTYTKVDVDSKGHIVSGGPLVQSDLPALNVVIITVADTPYTLTGDIDVLLCDASGGLITVNLPAASSSTRPIVIKEIDLRNQVDIVPNLSDTVDTGGGFSLYNVGVSGSYSGIRLDSDRVLGWWLTLGFLTP